MTAQEWFTRGQEANDPFDALSNFWRAFNHLFFPGPNAQERDKIRRFLRQNVGEAEARDLLRRHPEPIRCLLEYPVIDMRSNGRDMSANITAFHAADPPQTKLEELLMIIYQVRCNFEHGQKAPSNDRDRGLCASAAVLLRDVIAITVI
jgi:hypothetical protein